MAHRRTNDERLVVTGANAVRELLASTHPVERLWLRAGGGDALAAMAAARGVPVEFAAADQLARVSGGPAHQGVVARTPPFRYAESEALAAAPRGTLVVLDGVQDPRNLGAIVRTARAAGAAGVIVPKDRASGVTGVVVSASAGHVFALPVARVTNVARVCEALKGAGWWLVALVATAERSIFEVASQATRPALVLGGEGGGVRPLVLRGCDFRASIPMAPGVDSLNVSVAAGVALYALSHVARCSDTAFH